MWRINLIIKDLPTPKTRRDSVRYNLSKLAPSEAERRQTKRARTKENAITVDELVLSQQDQPQIYR